MHLLEERNFIIIRTMSLENIKVQYKEALSQNDFEQIKVILASLNNLSSSEKKDYLDLYEEIDNDLFQIGRSESNNNLERFKLDIKEWETRQRNTKVVSTKNEPTQSKNYEDFDIIFKKFYERHQSIFSKLKDYYLFKLEQTTESCETELIVLCDDDSHKRPELSQLFDREMILKKNKETLNDFTDRMNSLSSTSNANYICLLSLTPSLREEESSENIINSLKNLILTFTKIYSLRVLTKKNGEYENFAIETFSEDKVAQLIELSNKLFNNSKLSYQEQNIIKPFFGPHPAVIDYKVLKPGASGSSVIEVQGNQNLNGGSKRYVVKLAMIEKGLDSKLKLEKKNFDDYVEPNQHYGYYADFKENGIYEAIKYSYASTDSVMDSISFFDLIKNYLIENIGQPSNIIANLNALFNIPLLNNWNRLNKKSITVKLLYQSYLKNDVKAIETICEVLNENFNTFSSGSFIEKYNKLLIKSIEINKKICHGDLHTENFFWDSSTIYLIDFGHTGLHHAVVDHTFLEISIRLRHFPNFISIDEYIAYEKIILCEESFQPGFDLSFIKREKIRCLYELIYNIRLDAKKYCLNPAKPLNEYLISLFIISFRLTQYKDLNPLFSFRMAELFLNEIN